jgi:hypothetical protein
MSEFGKINDSLSLGDSGEGSCDQQYGTASGGQYRPVDTGGPSGSYIVYALKIFES